MSKSTVSSKSSHVQDEITESDVIRKSFSKNDISRRILPFSDGADKSEEENEREQLILSFLEIICSPQHLPVGANPDAYQKIASQLQKEGIISTQAMETPNTTIKNIYHKLITQYNIPFQYLLQHNELVSTRYMNEFQEKEKLGSGGYGNVFKAYHKIDDHDYAVKKLPLSQYENLGPEILREVRSLAKFNHPNIVRYYSSWIEYDLMNSWEEDSDDSSFTDTHKIELLPKMSNDIIILPDDKINIDETLHKTSKSIYSPDLTLFIQLELCHQTLGDYLSHRNTMIDEITEIEYAEAINIFKQIVIGIKYIHNMQYIHRDLKPANIFINYLFNEGSSEGRKIQVKIGDFGLIRQTPWPTWKSWSESPGIITDAVFPLTTDIGTTIYAAPEQIKNVNDDKKGKTEESKTALIGYNQKTDMYSLGIIFFELLSVFKTEMERHIKIKDLKNGKINEDMKKKYPQECKIILRLTQKDPHKRMNLSDLILPSKDS